MIILVKYTPDVSPWFFAPKKSFWYGPQFESPWNEVVQSKILCVDTIVLHTSTSILACKRVCTEACTGMHVSMFA